MIFIGSEAISQNRRLLSLEQCIDIAIENNLSVKRSELNLQNADINLLQARAQRFPTLNLNGNYGFNWGRGIDPTTNQFIDQRINFNGFSGNTSMPIMNGLQTTNSIKQGKLDRQASEYDLAKAVNDISLDISLFYLNVILNRELLDNARFQLESSTRQLEQTTVLVESGALPLANKLQLQSQVASNEVALINAQNNLDLSLLTLKQALLLPPGEEIDIVVPELEVNQAELETSSVMDVYQVALDNQPEIKGADLRVESAEVGLDVSRGGMYPSLSLGGGFSTNYSDAFVDFIQTGATTVTVPTDFETISGESIVRNVEIPEGNFETVGISKQYDNNFSRRLSLNLSVPIFNGFRTRSDIQRSKIAVQQAEISRTEQQNFLYQTIETAYRNALAASKTFSASQRQVTSLEETLRAVENQYNNGAANFTDLQVAQNNLYQARTDLSRAKLDFVFRKKVLEFYQGKPLTF